MGRHSPGEGRTPVAELIGLSEGATEEYADELREMRDAIAEDVEHERREDARDRYQEEVEA